MLIIMTCNGWLIIGVFVGYVVGYFLFQSKYSRKVSKKDHLNETCCN